MSHISNIRLIFATLPSTAEGLRLSLDRATLFGDLGLETCPENFLSLSKGEVEGLEIGE